jgi:DNA-binding MarR family transcriptional regulator
MLNRMITAIYDDALASVGLKASQFNLLVATANREETRPAELAKYLEMDESTLSRNVERMCNKGWLGLEPGEDRRSHVIKVTDKGRALIRKAYPAWQKAQDDVSRRVGADSIAALKSVHFIAAFLAIAVVAIALVIWWEWHYDDPVVELTLLRERNFAIANAYYFLFAFGLFGSTVLIPEMLQTLFGNTATDAGLVLGPGAAVITLLAPFVVRIVPRIGAKRLLAASFTIAALSFFYYSGMTTETDDFHFTLARCLQGFGYAFMFVPVSQLAYSYLPKNKNNKGSSLTNLCRNWGGSFGIAFVTTMLERRTQYHQSVLVSNLTSADGSVRQFVRNSSHYLVTRGANTPDAIHQAYGLIGNAMNQQQCSHSWIVFACWA